MSVCAILQTPGLAITRCSPQILSMEVAKRFAASRAVKSRDQKCPVEKHIQNVIPIEERACLQVPTELAARREGALGVALPPGS